jgi:hypothetical protein
MCNLADQWKLEKNKNIQKTDLWRLEAYYTLKDIHVNFESTQLGDISSNIITCTDATIIQV